MDLTATIDRHHRALTRLVGLMFAMVGLGEGRAVERLARPMYRAVLRLLYPAEAALRRLIVVAARDIVVKPRPPRPAPAGLNITGRGHGPVSFQLFDPPVQPAALAGGRRGGPGPRIRIIDVAFDPRIPLFRAQAAPRPGDGTVNAVPLCRRLAALEAALADMPRQARRYACWRDRPAASRRPQRAAALRPGPPPGFRRRPACEVDEILTECDWLARQLPGADTS